MKYIALLLLLATNLSLYLYNGVPNYIFVLLFSCLLSSTLYSIWKKHSK
ncbi:hypothetical protein PNC201_17585 [Pseudoalteromonas sp. NC201]|nr:hypothetical protein PNC201_17585 [Pseudoalteromonas sp. NC201]